jgi:hypothetical protein
MRTGFLQEAYFMPSELQFKERRAGKIVLSPDYRCLANPKK